VTPAELIAALASNGVRLWLDGNELRYDDQSEGSAAATLIAAARARRGELQSFLNGLDVAGNAARGPVLRAPAGLTIRASSAQERFLITHELAKPADQYLLSAAFELGEPVEAMTLERAIEDIVERHVALRSAFAASADGYVLRPGAHRTRLTVRDLEPSALMQALHDDRRAPFDLITGPHFRVVLYRQESGRQTLLFVLHHIVCDGASIRLLLHELGACYDWRAGRRVQPPAQPHCQIDDFAYTERRPENAESLQRQLQYWVSDLATAPERLELGCRRPVSRDEQPGVLAIPLRINTDVLLRAAPGSRKMGGVTQFQLALSSLALLLHKYGAGSSVVIATPWHNRVRPGSERIVGPLLNVLPIHIRIPPGTTVDALRQEVVRRSVLAMDHGDVAFERILEAANRQRGAAPSMGVEVMCAVEDAERPHLELAGATAVPMELPNDAARYDVALILRPEAGSLVGTLKLSRAKFGGSMAQQMAEHLVAAFQIVSVESRTLLAAASLLSARARDTQLLEWGRGPKVARPECTLTGGFVQTATRFGKRIALQSEQGTMTYEELLVRATALADHLARLEIGAEDFVAISLERSSAYVVAVLGVLLSGAAFVPIDPALPADRRAWMMEDARVAAVIGMDASGSRVPRIPASVLFDLPQGAALAPNAAPKARSACFLMYTSGSSGSPKGVVIEHEAITNNILWMNEEWPLTQDDALLFKASCGFDVSVKEILWPLTAGARLVIAKPGGHLDPDYLCALIRYAGISVIHLVPSMVDVLVQRDGFESCSTLRIVMCGGEAVNCGLRRRLHARSAAVLLHMYGPTEAAIAVTGYAVDRDHPDTAKIPLGRPMPNCDLLVVDEDFQIVPPGVAGELCIAGMPMARGYAGRPDLSAVHFVPNPFGPPGTRMYRTGDRVIWRDDGLLEYIGRRDRQMKIRGVRIEPGEIEEAMRSITGVDDAVVIAAGLPPKLVAYAASKSASLSVDAIRAALQQRLPASMLPALIGLLDRMPTGINGKIDVSALPPIEAAHGTAGSRRPAGELEHQIAAIWERVLEVPSVGREDNFFDLGGHSLQIINLRDQLRGELRASVAINVLYEHPTVAGLANYLSATRTERARRWMKRTIGERGSGFGN
jgi:amino acid adenylation domain-containing protein